MDFIQKFILITDEVCFLNRFFAKNIDRDNKVIEITGNDARHICKVLRKKPGQKVTVYDGKGLECLAEITDATPCSVTLRALSFEEAEGESPLKITLFQGIPKGQKMDYIIQKAVEIGVHTIVPVITERVVVRFDSKKDEKSKTERWNKIAYEACKQAARGRIAEVTEPVSFSDALKSMREHTVFFMPYEEEKNNGLKAFLQKTPNISDIAFIIGPEGGFSEKEVSLALSLGIETITLGKRILRTETAPIFLLSVLIYECEHRES